ncbi:MAG TPA: electron transport complex subunit RsxC, partial [Chromatiales bacterium]|nr:electron transport complex subunit RsxC [Chromatiales bacterium]
GTDESEVTHASVSGELLGLNSCPNPDSAMAGFPCAQIRSDGKDEWHPDCAAIPDVSRLQPDEICRRIAAGGILGLGGALFPTAKKLCAGPPLRALIINGVECEPYLSCDEILMMQQPERVIAGTRIMMHASGAPAAVIVVETDMPDARVSLHKALDKAGIPDISIAVVTAKYPAGGERQLIELLTGREVPAGGLPRDIGYLCQNVGTAAAVADLFDRGRPLISRIVTVTGQGVSQPRNFDVRLGTPVADLIHAAGGPTRPDTRLIMGGPMMGVALNSDELPVGKATNCVIVAAPDELAQPADEYPCIRCAECSEACPARLLPQSLLVACRNADIDAMAHLGLDACIECGCCDYVCPSHINLTALFASAKHRLRDALQARERARTARLRSQARDARLARQQDHSDSASPQEDPSALIARLSGQQHDEH